MELVKDIYFNTDKLVENTKIKVSYTGKFYQKDNEKVFLHYGFGESWNNVNEIEMSKTDLGYQAELNLQPAETLNFCFKNQNNEWDNNFGNNYIFNIEKQPNVSGKSNEGNSGFFGKNFGKGNDESTASNIYWKSENEPSINKTISEPVTNSFDTVIPKNNLNINSIGNIKNNASQITSTVIKAEEITNYKPSQSNCYAVIQQNSGDTQVVATINPSQLNKNVGGNNETAIALAPTGFALWTNKIKQTVCNFFDKLPKLISGNYKRDISNNNNNNLK